MLKGILLSVVIVACAAAGRTLSNVHKRRAELFSELLAAVRVLRLRMLNSLEPIGILLRRSDTRLFRDLGNNLRDGASLAECWQELSAQASRRGRELDCLAQSDVRILDELFAKLGASGREEQNALFSMILAQLETAQDQAQARSAETSRMYTTLGALLGIGISVLIA